VTKLVDKDSTHIVEDDNITPPPMYEGDGHPQVLTSDTARQGPLGKPVLWVLIAALVLVVIGFAAAFMFSGTPPAG
jgi:hypothetical protein